ncbi:hypothetical protein SteCoe_23481 [Stentor coeruleus]|uniref:Uncharacterized protein n=1 Tax=Stentor coeruleus TaxID=5963 RepID=A0A1R2BJQ5_9CILI|nr:hypothetical protein SteCoe_23481 [Stentor coeruleus]
MSLISPLFEINPFTLPQPTTIRFSHTHNCLRHPNRIPMKPFEDFETILNIPCINCQELVNVSRINEHSQLCVYPTSKVLDLESGNEVEEVRFKVINLKKVLEEIAAKPHIKPNDNNCITIMIRHSMTVLNTRNTMALEHILDSLNTMIQVHKGSLATMIYAERLAALVVRLLACLIGNENAKTKVNEKNSVQEKTVIKSLQEQVEFYKTRTQNLQKVVARTQNISLQSINIKLEAIKSEIDSLSPSVSPGTSILLDESSLSPGISDNEDQRDDEELKRYFFSLCLSYKIKLSATGRIKPNLSISKLYHDALDKKIKPEDWKKYVNQQFCKPDQKFIEKKPRRRPPGKFMNIFETITEEQ